MCHHGVFSVVPSRRVPVKASSGSDHQGLSMPHGQVRSTFTPSNVDLGSLALQVGQVCDSLCASQVGLVNRSVPGIGHIQLPVLSGSPSSGGLEAGLFITRIGLSLGQGYVHDLRYRGRSSSRGRLWRWVRSMSRRQAVKVVGRERRNLAVVSSSGGSKLWRYNANSLWRQQ